MEKENDYRTPRKNDRVRFWELQNEIRVQVTALILSCRGSVLTVQIDGRGGTQITRTRQMEIIGHKNS